MSYWHMIPGNPHRSCEGCQRCDSCDLRPRVELTEWNRLTVCWDCRDRFSGYRSDKVAAGRTKRAGERRAGDGS